MRFDTNSYEGQQLRVLFVCSMGMLRSPTAAYVAQKEFDWNTRSAGLDQDALVPVTQKLLNWADKVYVFGRTNLRDFKERFGTDSKPKLLDIPDEYDRMDQVLQKLILVKLHEFGAKRQSDPE